MSLFVGNFYGISFGMADILSMALLCMIMSVAVPPTQGYGYLPFLQLYLKTGIPWRKVWAMAASLFILFDYLMTTGNVLSINISMLHTEHFLGKASQREMARFSASA